MMDYMFTEEGHALYLVHLERNFQDAKWGPARVIEPNAYVNMCVLTEEVGEVARAMLEHDEQAQLEELVQVCAYSLAWIKDTLKDNPKMFERTKAKIQQSMENLNVNN